MIHIYYILLLIINIILATLYGPQLLALIKRYFTRIKRKPSVDCVALLARVEKLEQQYKKRQVNFKSRVREEVIEYLEQLKNK